MMNWLRGVRGIVSMGCRHGGRAAVAGCLVSVVVGGLGGCGAKQKEEIARLSGEVNALREETAQKDSAISSLQAQIAAKPQQPVEYYPPDGPGPDRPTPGPGRDVVLTVAGDVLFASGQATLRPEAKKELDRVVATLKGQYPGHRIRIEGYTDSDPIKKSPFPSNQALSQARAEAVETHLVSKGIPASRVSAVGMGSTKAKATKQASRRVEIVVLARG